MCGLLCCDAAKAKLRRFQSLQARSVPDIRPNFVVNTVNSRPPQAKTRNFLARTLLETLTYRCAANFRRIGKGPG
jgi:hypothetical protein